MKLPIKKEYFDAIKNGSKKFEYRDAHITFICEETGRAMRKEVIDISLVLVDTVPDKFPKALFDDEKVIEFELAKVNDTKERVE